MTDLRAAVDDVRYGEGNGTSDYWRGFNDGIDKLAERLEGADLAVTEAPDFLDGARLEYQECMEVRRLLGYLWNATGKNHLRPVHDLFADDDPIVADVERLAIFADVSRDDAR